MNGDNRLLEDRPPGVEEHESMANVLSYTVGLGQRMVAAYIEEHLAEQIPLATLARLVRLSPCHFSRAFKQSFGVPPHRYHTGRRIERRNGVLL